MNNQEYLTSLFSKIFLKLLTGIMMNDLKDVRHYLSEELYNKYQSVVDNNIKNNEVHCYDELNVKSITINDVQYAVVAGSYTNTTTATMTVYLDKDNTSEWACYKIDNTSTQLAASLSANVTQVASPNTSYFGTITSAFYSDNGCTTSLSGNVAAGQSAYLKVTVPKGSSEPTADVTNASFTVTITATPAS